MNTTNTPKLTRLTKKATQLFESIKRIDEDGNEWWSSRDLARVLTYTDYRNFLKVIDKGREACENSNVDMYNHFVEVNEMVSIGSAAERQIDSVKLSRYACYLTVQNADPAKKIVAQAHTYFALQTRIAELKQQSEYRQLTQEEERRLFLRHELLRHNANLADAACQAGIITPREYAIFQNHGYKGLYGGLDARAIHSRKGLKPSQKILDHMGSTELAANLFRATQTEEKLRRENIQGRAAANHTHYEVGCKVRQTIAELGGTMPENLPTEDSISLLERKQKAIEKSNVASRLQSQTSITNTSTPPLSLSEE